MPRPDRPRVGELVLGILLIAVGLAGLASVVVDPFLDSGIGSDPGPGLMPRLLLGLLILAGLGQMAAVGVRAVLAGGLQADPGFEWRTLVVPFLLVVAVGLYTRAVPAVGYLAATGLFCLVGLVAVELRSGHVPRPAKLLLMTGEAAVLTLVLWGTFKLLIHVPLP